MLVCDVTDGESVDALVSSVLSQTGRIDLLVNNAGIGLFGGAEESSIEQIRSLFEVNLFGAIRMTNAVLPSMRKHGGGRIINISSALGFIPGPYGAHYTATKHALEGYSQSLDHEVCTFNIRVSLIEPAFTKTVLEQNALRSDAMIKDYDQARAAAYKMLHDVQATASPPDVVRTAATTKVPKLRYPAGKDAKMLSILRRFAPAGVFDKSLRKQLRLPA